MYTVIETRIKVVKKDATGGRRIPKGPPMSVVAPWQGRRKCYRNRPACPFTGRGEFDIFCCAGTALVLKEKVAEQCSIEPASAATFRLIHGGKEIKDAATLKDAGVLNAQEIVCIIPKDARELTVGPSSRGGKASLAFLTVNLFCMALLCGYTGCLTAKNGVSGPGSWPLLRHMQCRCQRASADGRAVRWPPHRSAVSPRNVEYAKTTSRRGNMPILIAAATRTALTV
jgi:hypothetical protein